MKTTEVIRFIALALCCSADAFAVPAYRIVPLGLDDFEHARNDGFKYGTGLQSNEAGQVRGRSDRYNGGSAYLGSSAWLYDGTSTINIGLTGSEHTRMDGYKWSRPHGLNGAGQVIGRSDRFNGGVQLGDDAWLYDPVLKQTFSMQLSTRSDGYADSDIVYLGDDGLVLGRYMLFDALDNELGWRAFYFTQ